MQRAGLIDNASGEEIHQDHIHLMHEADIYAWKCTWPLALNLRPGYVGAVLSRLSPSTVAQVSGTYQHPQTSLHPSSRQKDETFMRIQHCLVMVASPPLLPHSSSLPHPHNTSSYLSHHLIELSGENINQCGVITECALAEEGLAFLSLCCASDLWKYHRLNL